MFRYNIINLNHTKQIVELNLQLQVLSLVWAQIKVALFTIVN